MTSTSSHEIIIRLGGQNYSIEPTYSVLEAAEGRLDETIVEIIGKILKGGIKETTTLIWCAIVKAKGMSAPSHDEIGEFIVDAGIKQIITGPGFNEFLKRALGAGQTKKKCT